MQDLTDELTKDNCKSALFDIINEFGEANESCLIDENIFDKVHLLGELIEEHFKLVEANSQLINKFNQLDRTAFFLEYKLDEIEYMEPYKFKDLCDMKNKPIWDNKDKRWLLLIRTFKFKNRDSIEVLAATGVFLQFTFKKNRFYPREVK